MSTSVLVLGSFFALQASHRFVFSLLELQRTRGDGERRAQAAESLDVAHLPPVAVCNARRPRRILAEPRHAGTPGDVPG